MDYVECPKCGDQVPTRYRPVTCYKCGPIAVDPKLLPSDPVQEEIPTLFRSNRESSSVGPKMLEILAGVGGCLAYFVLGIGALVLLAFIFNGVPWYADNVQPIVGPVCVVGTTLLVGASFILAVFRKTRPWAGLGFTISSYLLGLDVWLTSLITAYYLAGVGWLIIGICFAGFGVIPIAIIAAFVSAEWGIGIVILILAFVVFGLRALGAYLLDEEPISTPETSNYTPL
jgi:hypothetical protein